MLINKNFQTWLLIGWQHSHQPIRCHVRKSLLTHWGQVTHICIDKLAASLVQIMACCLLGATSFYEPILIYFQLDHCEYISVIFKSKCNNFHLRKCIWRMFSAKWWSFWFQDNCDNLWILTRIFLSNPGPRLTHWPLGDLYVILKM